MFVLKGLVGLHRTIQLQLLWHCGWGIDLDYCDIERFALEMNRDHPVRFASTTFQTPLLTMATPLLLILFLFLPIVQFSRSVLSDYLWPHGLQHGKPPCPSPNPRVYSNSRPLSQWCHPTTSSSVIPFSSHFQSFPSSGTFKWVSSSYQVAKVLEFELQHQSYQWTPRADLLQNGLVGSPCSWRDSQESFPTPHFKSINFSALFSL